MAILVPETISNDSIAVFILEGFALYASRIIFLSFLIINSDLLFINSKFCNFSEIVLISILKNKPKDIAAQTLEKL